MSRTLSVAAAVSVLVVAWLGWTAFLRAPAADAPDVLFTVQQNTTAAGISRQLAEKKLVPSALLFTAYVRLTGAADDLNAGAFALKPGMSLAAIARLLASEEFAERRITLIEGWGIREMGQYLVAAGAITDPEEWYAAVGTPPSVAGVAIQKPGIDVRAEFAFLSAVPSGATLEGFLFPDTYRVALDATAEDIARTLLRNFDRRVEPDTFARLEKHPYEVVTLASIVEREVRTEEDRRMVADIFHRRLAERMPLQADSTVNYVTAKKTPALSQEDRDLDSPWNTYLYPGLPPSPIGNPSLQSIRAVLDPLPNPYVYFLTDDEGSVHYARTFAEHVANKNLYLR